MFCILFSVSIVQTQDKQMLYLTSCKMAADFLSKTKFSKYLTGSSYSTYLPEKVLFFLPSCPNWPYCNLGTKKYLPFLLIFFHQWRHSITGRHTRKGRFFDYIFFTWAIIQQLLFQQTYSLFLGWPYTVQTQYRNIDKVFEEIPL